MFSGLTDLLQNNDRSQIAKTTPGSTVLREQSHSGQAYDDDSLAPVSYIRWRYLITLISTSRRVCDGYQYAEGRLRYSILPVLAARPGTSTCGLPELSLGTLTISKLGDDLWQVMIFV